MLIKNYGKNCQINHHTEMNTKSMCYLNKVQTLYYVLKEALSQNYSKIPGWLRKLLV